uniref:BTB domain-containing protein n=1 Tax=Alexandrium catenella TaxID=2925 RepID=A0A7S1W5K9_ALECA
MAQAAPRLSLFRPHYNSQLMAEEGKLIFHTRGERFAVAPEVAAKVPFLDSLLADRIGTKKNEHGEPVIDRDPALVRAVLEFVSSGDAMHLFTKLPKASSAKDMLVELDFFCVEPPAVRPISDKSFKTSLKDVKDEYQRVCKRGPIEKSYSANRFGARNAAAELAVGLESATYDLTNHRIRQELYNSVLFVISHSRTFGPRMRHHILGVGQDQGPLQREANGRVGALARLWAE